MKHIIFVCTGNTCRSSMAEGLLKRSIENDTSLNGKFTVSSAGVSAFEGDAASSNSIKVLKDEWGIDISKHQAKRITQSDVERADLILTMTKAHKQAVLEYFPKAAGKTYTLKEYVYEDKASGGMNRLCDVNDPYGMPLYGYKVCAHEIKEALDMLVRKLKNE